MPISTKPISKMKAPELKEYARDLYKNGYSRANIFKLTDGKISERQIRKIYREAQTNPMLKEWHNQNMKGKKLSITYAVRGYVNTQKEKGIKINARERQAIRKKFERQSFEGMYARNHPKFARYIGKEGSLRKYIEVELE